MNWYSLPAEKVMEVLETSAKGLSSAQAEIRLQKHGKNELIEKKKRPAWILFVNQFKDFMILVLIIAAVISGLAGDVTDTIIILVIILINATVGFIQEYRAEKAMDALKEMASLHVEVLRDENSIRLHSSLLVPGDIVLLDAGNALAADLRLIEAHSMRIDESTLTGESVPVDKSVQEIESENISIGDRINLAYKGTVITNGRGKGVVISTGMNTEIGKIASMLQTNDPATPLQKRMADFGKKLSYIILSICALLFVIGLIRGEEPMRMLLISISLAVAAIPEALPALITVALSRGAKRMVKQQALIRKLPAVETLGSVSYICSDKTGTLTLNKMKVVQTYIADNTPISNQGVTHLMAAMALNHDVKKNPEGVLTGDPTEIALVEYAQNELSKEEYKNIFTQFPRVAELPFDSERKCMTTVHRIADKFLVISKGALESIVDKLVAGKNDYQKITSLSTEWGNDGLRVLAYGYKYIDQLPEPFTYHSIENNLLFAGLTGMIDPPREEVKLAIKECKTAGITPVMITGDHPSTAAAIAREIGILGTNELVVSGAELSAMSDYDLNEKVEKIRVYARVSPEQKMRIVKALQSKNHFVAMTGDGVNDAPSLKASNIGVAMGINGTDVSKEAAHMILLDDNFATIVKAVREGRRIYDNIRKFVKYIMTCNSAEIWTIFLAPIIGLPMPLLPIHILWINLVTDGLPGIALASEKAESDIMNRPPRKSSESLFSDGIAYHIMWVGLLMAAITLGLQAWAIKMGDTHWQTMVFTVLSLAQLGHVFAIRSDRQTLFSQGITSNKPLLGAVILTCVLQLMVIYLPFANAIFKTQPLTLIELLICIGAAATLFHAVEFEKWVKRKKRASHSVE
ncbi:MAG: cation-translocating P-type ATPase [Cyclobacteriaceae bacterium]|nr:cation-translocating P-type ATPase [Cyclobacteriaceae bacterium]